MKEQSVNLLPGPVTIRPNVREAFMRPPLSHRSAEFMADMQRIRGRICRLVNAGRVEILVGSGTVANDAIAAHLRDKGTPGLIVSNGEFGDRLIEHGERFNLPFEIISAPWGAELPYERIDQALADMPEIRWMWVVHCETSTGVLADLDRLRQLAARHDVKLCLDAISTIGTVPVDLQGVYLASGVSGKGLGSYPGLALVYHHDEILPSPDIPRYLDLGTYAKNDGVPFTHSSNLVYALDAALDRFHNEEGALDPERVFRLKRQVAAWLRPQLERLGFSFVAPEKAASPAVLSIVLPEHLDSVDVGEHFEREGFILSYRSAYLVQRNVIQVCLMGDQTLTDVAGLVEHLRTLSLART